MAVEGPRQTAAARSGPRLRSSPRQNSSLEPESFSVVGLGASAGGLDAFRRLLGALPSGTGMAFILIQHLDPTHPSMMVDLLIGHTPMTVQQAADGMPLEPEHVYLIPPGTYLSIQGGALRYTARETRAFAGEIGLVPRTTPIESPQSNGMAEAFAKTLKRDYARVSARPDAASVLRQLDAWFDHYNTIHPHKALGYRSPREFRKQLVEKTTENAVGAGRRPHEGTTATEAIGSRPTAAQRAVARSASLDAGAAVAHP